MPTYRNTYNGAERTTAQTMGYPWLEIDGAGGDPVEEQTEFAERTADAILLDVGNDPVKAQEALDAEEAREQPRKVLSAKLQRIVEDFGS